MYADIFTIFTGILSGPVAFLTSKRLIILFIWSTIAALILSSAVDRNSFLIHKMHGWFLNLSIIVVAIYFSLTLLAKVPNFVEFLQVVLFTMLI